MGSLSLLTLSNLSERESITLLSHWFPVPVKVSQRSGSYSGIWWLSQHDMAGFLALATHLSLRSHGVGGSVSCGAIVSFYFTAVLFELPAMILSVDGFCDFLSLSVNNLTSGSCFRFVPVEQPVRSSVDDFPVGQFGGALSLGHVS
ncbi:hypothetical protein DY000_02051824 [Brassica cretica]|uniref:Uncharacterized protein n=1 Tax=Brassica cretica TaxID=69181 RepID=A0ABQ7AER7_BRACR|nr:hypothetical protein DY000_02051824 [Brassica cretica]